MVNDEASIKRLWSYLLWMIVALFVLLLVGMAIPGHVSKKGGYQMESETRMKHIASTIALYQADHGGTPPDHLSQLLAYIRDPKAFYFQSESMAYLPSTIQAEPKLVDAFAPYAFTIFTDGSIMVFERMPMWNDFKIGYCILTKKGNMESGRIRSVEFEKKYSHDFR